MFIWVTGLIKGYVVCYSYPISVSLTSRLTSSNSRRLFMYLYLISDKRSVPYTCLFAGNQTFALNVNCHCMKRSILHTFMGRVCRISRSTQTKSFVLSSCDPRICYCIRTLTRHCRINYMDQRIAK